MGCSLLINMSKYSNFASGPAKICDFGGVLAEILVGDL